MIFIILYFLFRYVVRGKAGKKQSSKDAGGRFAHSAGASMRRYNELALKKVFDLVTSLFDFVTMLCQNSFRLFYDGYSYDNMVVYCQNEVTDKTCHKF